MEGEEVAGKKKVQPFLSTPSPFVSHPALRLPSTMISHSVSQYLHCLYRFLSCLLFLHISYMQDKKSGSFSTTQSYLINQFYL